MATMSSDDLAKWTFLLTAGLCLAFTAVVFAFILR